MQTKIKSIHFLNGWDGSQSIRIKAYIEHIDELSAGKEIVTSEVIIEQEEAKRILLERLNVNGFELSLKPMQKMYRVIAK